MGAFLSALGGLATGVFGNLVNMPFEIAREKRNYDLQYQYNEKAAENAFNRQVDFWNMQNAYNTPSAQMERLREAGLNPALMNSGGAQSNSAGGLSSVASGGVQNSSSTNPTIDLMALSKMSKMLKDGGLVDAETANLLQLTANSKLEYVLKQLVGKDQWLKIKDQATSMGYSIPDSDYYDTLFGLGSTPSPDGLSPAKADYDLKKSEAERNKSQAFLNDTLSAVENSLITYKQNLLIKQSKEIDAKISSMKHQNALLREEIKSMSYDNQIKSLIAQLNSFFGTDISGLPAELIYKAGQYYSDCINGIYTYESTLDAFTKAVNAYMDKAIHIPASDSVSYTSPKFNVSILKGLMSLGFDAGAESESHAR